MSSDVTIDTDGPIIIMLWSTAVETDSSGSLLPKPITNSILWRLRGLALACWTTDYYHTNLGVGISEGCFIFDFASLPLEVAWPFYPIMCLKVAVKHQSSSTRGPINLCYTHYGHPFATIYDTQLSKLSNLIVHRNFTEPSFSVYIGILGEFILFTKTKWLPSKCLKINYWP